MRDFWEFVIDLLPITFRSVSAGLERPRGQNPRGRGQNPRGRGRGPNPRGRGQVFRPRGRGQASRPNIPVGLSLWCRYRLIVRLSQKIVSFTIQYNTISSDQNPAETNFRIKIRLCPNWAYYYLSPFGVLWVHMAWHKNCLKKKVGEPNNFSLLVSSKK